MKRPFLTLAFLFILFLISSVLSGQQLSDYGFKYWKDLPAKVNNTRLLNAWAGGLNNIQTAEIDLNFDGYNDLMLFEKHGNRLLPFVFIPGSETNQPGYEFDPSFRKHFPPVNSIFQLNDYNNDGKPDIFTYTTGGLLVYKNVSENTLQFERVTFPYIRSLQGQIFTNLLVTNVDYPVIDDLDDDGDLDILTFWGLGSFIELHRNMSMEEYGTADSLLYHKVDNCWGRFMESPETNEITLDTCVDFRSGDRHTGSTLALLDINNDGKRDLLLGDVDYSSITGLVNSGTDVNARMVAVVDSFPFQNPVNLASFPVVCQADLYNDGQNDLIVSPFDPSLTKSRGYESLWHYTISENTFQLESKTFLQDQMIDNGLGAYPVFVEITGDSLTDLVIANYGNLDTAFINNNNQLVTIYSSSISLYKNIGTRSNPEFEFITGDFAGLNSLRDVGLYPAFADITNDGLTDMLIGKGSGDFLFFKNTGYVNGLPVFNNPVNINSQGNETFLTPFLIDIDKDGLTDIVSGNKSGRLSYYQNTGTLQTPLFNLITNNFGKINVTDSIQSYNGYSIPCFFQGKSGDFQLVVGSESGRFFYYPELSTDPLQRLEPKNDVFDVLRDGIRSSLSLKNINNDSYIDMAAGNYAGGVIMYKGVIPGPVGIGENLSTKDQIIRIIPNPAQEKMSLMLPFEGKWKISVFNSFGQEVMQQEFSGINFESDIKRLGSGFYIVTASQLYGFGRTFTAKLLITR